MSQSFVGNFIHCVFSTKERRNIIPADLQQNLWAYLHGIGRNLHIKVIGVGGTRNHVHILMQLPTTISLSEAVQKLKANSSRWMGEQGITFSWQKGYGAFSVSPSMLGMVRAYIRNQEEHHKRRTFDEELSLWLRKCGVSDLTHALD